MLKRFLKKSVFYLNYGINLINVCSEALSLLIMADAHTQTLIHAWLHIHSSCHSIDIHVLSFSYASRANPRWDFGLWKNSSFSPKAFSEEKEAESSLQTSDLIMQMSQNNSHFVYSACDCLD